MFTSIEGNNCLVLTDESQIHSTNSWQKRHSNCKIWLIELTLNSIGGEPEIN
jgi:hypothetical protein